MPSYENEKCPVCNKQFTEGDDIVTCPDCGTPHHRKCYNSVGHCVNEDLHGTDYSFKRNTQKSEPDTNQNAQSNQTYYNPFSNEANENKTAEPSEPFNMFNPLVKTGYENSDEKFDGKSVSDAADVIKSNIQRFINKFISGKKISWNWGAFFFGPYYLFFRKMYKEGSLFLALRLIIGTVARGFYADAYDSFYSFVSSNYDALTSNPSDELMQKLMSAYNDVLPMLVIIFAAGLILNIIIAAFADNFYKGKVISVINKVDKTFESESFSTQIFSIGSGDVNLSKADMRRLYLGKWGGTRLFAPLTAFIVYDLINSIISGL